MKAIVYHGPGEKSWEEVPDPTIQVDTDAIVRVDAVTICGTDLHILKGDVPEVRPGTILGHEAVGIVEETGRSVTHLRNGDRVQVSRGSGHTPRSLGGGSGGVLEPRPRTPPVARTSGDIPERWPRSARPRRISKASF